MESNVENESIENRCKVDAQRSIIIGGLPRELFFDILSRLPITSLMHCKLVSQIWHSSSKHPLSTSMHLSRAKGRNSFLFCFSDYPISKLDAVDLSSPDNNTFLVKTQLSQTRNDQLYVYNPFTQEFRELLVLIKPTNLNVVRVNFGFGFHPRTKENKVTKIVYYTEGNNIFSGAIKEPEIFVLTLGDSEWRHKGQKAFRLSCMASDTLVNGNLHWLTSSYLIEEEKRHDIIAFDLATEEFQVITQPTGLGVNKLVALNNRLSVVLSSQGRENEIWELKDYSLKESWTRRLVIPNYVPADFRINWRLLLEADGMGPENKLFKFYALWRVEMRSSIHIGIGVRSPLTQIVESSKISELKGYLLNSRQSSTWVVSFPSMQHFPAVLLGLTTRHSTLSP